jgi:hypothetical protein
MTKFELRMTTIASWLFVIRHLNFVIRTSFAPLLLQRTGPTGSSLRFFGSVNVVNAIELQQSPH